jgi:NAD(P)-dependent dehydrogenase (short-subunit alcohol dehydrogenase family)
LLLLFAARAKVGCFDLQLENAQKTASEIDAAGGQALGILVDVSSEDSVKQGVDQLVNHFNSGLHVLLNGAASKDPSGTVADYRFCRME